MEIKSNAQIRYICHIQTDSWIIPGSTCTLHIPAHSDRHEDILKRSFNKVKLKFIFVKQLLVYSDHIFYIIDKEMKLFE